MSLYHEAAEVLVKAQKESGSLKSLVFGKKSWKSDPKALFALSTETAKWSDVLSEVVEKSGVLKVEKALTPTLAILLIHDLFLAKKGIALPATHGLNAAVSRHKVRLSAELTKARLRRGFKTLDDFRIDINSKAANSQQADSNGEPRARHPRWIRINTIKTSLDAELKYGPFSNYKQVDKLKEIIYAPHDSRLVYVDEHIRNLIAIASPDDPTSFTAYKQGKLILQEKASCFPAYLLNPGSRDGSYIDACAAPGNKTTHLAAILGEATGVEDLGMLSTDQNDQRKKSHRVVACEKDPDRSQTLQKMIKLAGANDIVNVKPKQNFLKLDPNASESADVHGLLLDPSCSGSGIFGRDEAIVTVHLPSTATADSVPKGKKRKRGAGKDRPQPRPEPETAIVEEAAEEEDQDKAKLKQRLENLSSFQLRIVEHAMSFPNARRITYSTCSVHAEENEQVVVKALLSDVAMEKGWRILKREEQVDGMKRWHKRGSKQDVDAALLGAGASLDAGEIAEGCIRCDKGGEDGTMGFFVAGFERDLTAALKSKSNGQGTEHGGNEEDEWSGFSEDET